MLVKKPSAFQKLLSRFFPVSLSRIKTQSGRHLIVRLYKGQYQLVFGRVFYSDGKDYFPIKKSLIQVGTEKITEGSSFLSLGSGIGSLSMVLSHVSDKKNLSVEYVDINPEILKLCEEITSAACPHLMHTYTLADANAYMKQNSRQYDFVVVDIFEEHVVPIFVFKKPFVLQIKNALRPGGFAIWNMMFHSEFQQHEFEIKLGEYFPVYDIITTRKNKIYIAGK